MEFTPTQTEAAAKFIEHHYVSINVHGEDAIFYRPTATDREIFGSTDTEVLTLTSDNRVLFDALARMLPDERDDVDVRMNAYFPAPKDDQ
jgi:hypothetical protein